MLYSIRQQQHVTCMCFYITFDKSMQQLMSQLESPVADVRRDSVQVHLYIIMYLLVTRAAIAYVLHKITGCL